MRKIKYKDGIKVKPVFLEYTGVYKDIQTEMQLFNYNDLTLEEFHEVEVEELEKHIDVTKVNWLNIHGLNNLQAIEKLGGFLKIDNFTIGDILNTTKRTRVEENHETDRRAHV